MLIGEISKKTGLTRDTIRFYEKKGLIKVSRTDSDWNNYKNYTENTLNRLLLIKKSKSFGFTLKEISELLGLFEMDRADCATFWGKVQLKLNEIDEKIQELANMKTMIIGQINDPKNTCSPAFNGQPCRQPNLA